MTSLTVLPQRRTEQLIPKCASRCVTSEPSWASGLLPLSLGILFGTTPSPGARWVLFINTSGDVLERTHAESIPGGLTETALSLTT